eukprot:8460647-Pyramimonas_sp.AAC.1
MRKYMHCFYPRAVGNLINTELIDDDPLRGNPRDVGDLSERIQYEFAQNEEFQYTSVASDRSASSPRRSPSRLPLVRKSYHDDPNRSSVDEEDEREDDDRMI